MGMKTGGMFSFRLMDRGCDEHPLHYYFYLTEGRIMPETKSEINKINEHWLSYTDPEEQNMLISLDKIVFINESTDGDYLTLHMQDGAGIPLYGIILAEMLVVLVT